VCRTLPSYEADSNKLMQLSLRSDPDGDSQMVYSSSSDEAESEAMFPSELEAPGPSSQTVGHVLSEPSEFTPPHSQDTGEAMDTSSGNKISQPVGNGGSANQSSGWVPQSDFAKSAARDTHEPGAGWNNKKAIDEYQRAGMQIEDKNFSLSRLSHQKSDEPILIACRGVWGSVR
jgi:hypothetical protein